MGTDGNLMNKIIRIGIVSTVNPEKQTARVTYPDESGTISGDLKIPNWWNNSKSATYHMPDIGDMVYCALAPNSRNNGIILCSVPNDKDIPLYNSPNVCGMKFGPIEIKLDRSDGSININTSGIIKINGKDIYLN